MVLSLLFIGDQATARAVLDDGIQDPELVEQVMHIGKAIASSTLVLGLGLCIISGLGCWGALNKHVTMLNIYMAIVAVITIITFTCLIYFAVNKSKVLKRTYDFLKTKLIVGYEGNYDNISVATITIDALQIYFDCCGIYDYREYENASMWDNRSVEGSSNDLTYPVTCCAWNSSRPKVFAGFDEEHFEDLQTCVSHSTGDPHDAALVPAASNYLTPCHKKITHFANSTMGIVFVIGSISFVVEFGSLMMAYIFKRNAQDDD